MGIVGSSVQIVNISASAASISTVLIFNLSLVSPSTLYKSKLIFLPNSQYNGLQRREPQLDNIKRYRCMKIIRAIINVKTS